MARNIPISTEEFIKKAISKHGDRYIYDKVDYKHSKIHITIICRKHGEFIQAPSMHILGQGCKKCAHEEAVVKAQKHGLSKRPMYKTWSNIKIRCYDVKSEDYPHYGGRGITISDEFKDYLKFEEYVTSLPKYKDKKRLKLSIDRIDVNGNYESGNLRWATQSEQCANRRFYEDRGNNKYTGIYFQWTWLFSIQNNGIKINKKGFKTEEEALLARNKYIAEHNLPHPIQTFQK